VARPLNARRWFGALGLLMLGAAASQPAVYAGFEALARVVLLLEKHHLAAPSASRLLDGAIAGAAAAAGDPWTAYIPAAAVPPPLTDDADGIGLRVVPHEDTWVLAEVVPGGPAARAGLQPGHRLLSVDGVALPSPDAGGGEAAEAALAGAPGTPVRLGVQAPGGGPEERTLLREAVLRPSVSALSLPGGLQVLRVWRFRPGTAEELRRALQAAGGPVLLDLRGNPGGAIEEAATAADLFLPAGEVATLEGRTPRPPLRSTDAPEDHAGPVGVWVDRHSASAAELLAAALQSRGRARVVGEPTAGKGTVQQLFPLESGGLLRVTIATWAAPGRAPLRPDAPLQPDALLPVHATAEEAAAALGLR